MTGRRRCRAVGRRGSAAGGFSLIEVLIALVVLAVGLLGLALLQTMNLRYTVSSQQRTQAVTLAGQMLDTIRLNRSELSAYSVAAEDFASVTVPVAGCTRVSQATPAANLARWKCEVKEILGASATAAVDVTNAPRVKVTVSWDDSLINDVSTDGPGKVVMETVL